MKRILVINGHPRSESLCGALAQAYSEEAKKSGYEVTLLELHRLQFDLSLHVGYKSEQPLEKDLVHAQQLIRAANHLVFVFPSWWASLPALLKGFIDRVFLPGFSFKYRKNSPLPEKLMKGKTGRIIITMDAPGWYYKWFNRAPGLNIVKKGTLEFCGVKPVKYTLMGMVRNAKSERIAGFFATARKIGARGA